MSYVIEAYQGEAKSGSFEWNGDYSSAKEEAGRFLCDDQVTRITVRHRDGDMLFSCLNIPHQ